MYKKIIVLLSFTVILFAGCSSDDASRSASDAQNRTINLQTKQDQWTYISMSSGKVVGTCALGDSVAEKSWKNRTDWDIAVCNGIIRTNSGTSGIGKGGIVNSNLPYDETVNVPDAQYHVDMDTVQVW